ncbi:hypothetical protein RUM43_013698 [Polyplax serrata]|uniref:DH domain-containing protein n=1 Tax=Polyplax serrata TaxID=468196 RepID=A0AAN8PC01_POLSC
MDAGLELTKKKVVKVIDKMFDQRVPREAAGNGKSYKLIDRSVISLFFAELEPEVGIEHLDDLKYPNADPPCHFCSQQSSTSIHDENRLKIVSGGLVRKRDGSRDEAANHYMNLPSPMIHNEGGDADSVFRPKPKAADDSSNLQNNFLDELREAQPPPSALSRRRAIITSRLTSNDLDDHKLSWSSNFNTPRNRRSSIVVIPPMQICPGDLLVYSKVLTNRQKTLDLESSSQCLNIDSVLILYVSRPSTDFVSFSRHFDSSEEESRKGKNTWSLLKLRDTEELVDVLQFERSNRGKGSIGGLEEVLGCIQKAEFEDEELSDYRGLSWHEFYTRVEEDKKNPKKKKSNLSDSSSSDKTSGTIKEDDSPTGSKVLPAISKPPELLTFETTAQVETIWPVDTSKSPTKSNRSAASDLVKPKKPEKTEKQETTVKKLHRKLVRAQSERCFERSRLPSWRMKEKPLPPKPMPLVQTLSEKNLVSPVSTNSQGEYKRREAVWDLFQSECAFLFDHLMVLKNVFLEPLKRIQVEGFAMFAEPQLLFGNLDELCSVSYHRETENLKMVPKIGEVSSCEVDSGGESLVCGLPHQREDSFDLFLPLFSFVIVLSCRRCHVPSAHVPVSRDICTSITTVSPSAAHVTHNFCKSFLRILLEKVGPNGELPTTEVLGELFQKNEEADSLSQAYHCYVLNYINALNYLETLRTHSEFCEFEKWCNKDERCKKLQLTDLLVAPVQHIMKVPLILKEVETRTEDIKEKIVISQILEIEEKSIQSVVAEEEASWTPPTTCQMPNRTNRAVLHDSRPIDLIKLTVSFAGELDDKMKWLKNFERLLEIQRNIVWPSVQELDPKIFVPDFLKPALQRQPCDRIIVSPRRQIIIEGQLQILDSGKAQEVFVVLFDDMLLITKRKKGLSKKCFTMMRPSSIGAPVTSCSPTETLRSLEEE